MEFEKILEYAPYALAKEEKQTLLKERLNELTRLHRERCPEYRQILDGLGFQEGAGTCDDIPFLPVRLFKELSLKSVPQEAVVKTMTSSGTTGQSVSKIFLDRRTAANQQKAMVKIVSDFTGSARMPMIIIDCPSVVKDRRMFSARGAGILGFSMFGSKKIYALDDEMRLDLEGIKAFLQEHAGEKILLFGFTFMVWQHFYKELLRLQKETGETLDLSNAVLIHGGGWKQLATEAVSAEEFGKCLRDVCGLLSVHDYYGMVEQTGCIYMQCECGHLHASIFSDVIIRDPNDFSICEQGKPGVIQVVSTIPESYPGHSLLTEDEGRILGEDDCPCGRKGKYFEIFGRLKNAEIRGCSDTYATTLLQSASGAESDAIHRKITYLVGNQALLEGLSFASPKPLFDETVIRFCADLSKELMGDPAGRAYPEIVTLGFWLRGASIQKMAERFKPALDVIKQGRGVAFHIAPGNVPLNFAYSLFAGLLTGNANVVRLPSKEYPQTLIVCRLIEKTLVSHEALRPYILLVRYERDRSVNDFLSSLCDVRVIWGGDQTIAEVRSSPLKPRATEVTFADRYSIAVIDAETYLQSKDKERITRAFYNDTYLSDQNACTSPRMVVWLGKGRKEARGLFWDSLHGLVKKQYAYQPIQGIDKLVKFCLAVSECGEEGLSMLPHEDNLLVRIQAEKVSNRLMEHYGNSGYFLEYEADDILELRPICDDSRCQSVALVGEASLLEPLLRSGLRGVDRIAVPGHTMDFDLLWDGYDLTTALTRVVTVPKR